MQPTVYLKPSFAEAHFNLGVVFDRKGMADDAIKEYGRAARFKPDYMKAHYNLAVALTNKGLIDHAKQELAVVGSIRHKKALEHYNRGVELANRDHFVDAMAEFRDALRLSPELYQAYNNLGVLLAHPLVNFFQIRGHFPQIVVANDPFHILEPTNLLRDIGLDVDPIEAGDDRLA